jgi:hypothetical protein
MMSRPKNVLLALGWYDHRLLQGIATYAAEHHWHLAAHSIIHEKVIPWGWSGDGVLAWLAALCLVGLAVLLQLNQAAIWLGLASLIPIVLYPLAKRVTTWPQVMLGFVFSWAAPDGMAAAMCAELRAWPGTCTVYF